MRSSGPAGEELAARFLGERGMRIIARNWRSGRLGELDIVARDGDALVIVEVKTVTTPRFGHPLSWVTPKKTAHLAALAEAFLAQYGELVDAVRFDVVAVDARKRPPAVLHLKDAFRPEDGHTPSG